MSPQHPRRDSRHPRMSPCKRPRSTSRLRLITRLMFTPPVPPAAISVPRRNRLCLCPMAPRISSSTSPQPRLLLRHPSTSRNLSVRRSKMSPRLPPSRESPSRRLSPAVLVPRIHRCKLPCLPRIPRSSNNSPFRSTPRNSHCSILPREAPTPLPRSNRYPLRLCRMSYRVRSNMYRCSRPRFGPCNKSQSKPYQVPEVSCYQSPPQYRPFSLPCNISRNNTQHSSRSSPCNRTTTPPGTSNNTNSTRSSTNRVIRIEVESSKRDRN